VDGRYGVENSPDWFIRFDGARAIAGHMRACDSLAIEIFVTLLKMWVKLSDFL